MIFLAFPGMGKTPLALSNGKYIDLDFGHFREAFGVPKEKESSLFPAFSKLMQKYEDDGYIVLSNEPDIMQFVNVTKVYLPVYPSYAAKKLKTDQATAQRWIEDWASTAKRFNVPVVWVEKGLDHYLNSFPPRNTQKKRRK